MNASIEFARERTVEGDFTPIAALTISSISPGDELICLPTTLCSSDERRNRDHLVTAAFISASLISVNDCSRIAFAHFTKAGFNSGPDDAGFELSAAMVDTGTCVTASIQMRPASGHWKGLEHPRQKCSSQNQIPTALRCWTTSHLKGRCGWLALSHPSHQLRLQ